MNFKLDRAMQILERTPDVLDRWLRGLDDEWIYSNEGPETFSPFDVVGHLIHGERTDWIARMNIILEQGESRAFDRYDRFAQYEESKGKSLDELLDTFASLRASNLEILRSKELTKPDLAKTGTHPTFGRVTLEQLLSTWAVHDLAHTAQIARTMAKQYSEAVGPWYEYLSILKK